MTDAVTGRILLVDDDRAFRLSTAALLEGEGHDVTGAASGPEAVRTLEERSFDLVLMDLRMPGVDGIDVVEVLRTRGESTPVLMVSGYGTVDAAVRALHGGVDDFLTKPVEPEILLERVRDLLRRRPSPDGGAADGRDLGLIGRSPAMELACREIRQVAGTDATVLITGETGTGKELAARAVHGLSRRARGPFVPVNCAALAEGVLESELFGHVRGAFTGAIQDRPGHFRAAQEGTLFLDEIGDIAGAVQHRLLRVLQEREVVPLGASRPVPVDVRLVAATHRDLRAAVADGGFRDDLYFRLDVYRIRLPPLRERRGDVPLLVEHFLGTRARDGAVPAVSPLAVRTLLAHHWPGNVRELFSALESALIRAGGGSIQAQHLPESVRRSSAGDGEGERYRSSAEDADERATIERALREANGVRVRAAEILGMGRTTLWRKMKEYGIEEMP